MRDTGTLLTGVTTGSAVEGILWLGETRCSGDNGTDGGGDIDNTGPGAGAYRPRLWMRSLSACRCQ